MTGACLFCGAPLRDDLSRTCSCRPASNIERAVLTAALVGSTEPRLPTVRERIRRTRELLHFAIRTASESERPS